MNAPTPYSVDTLNNALPDSVEQWTAALLNLAVAVVTFIKWLSARNKVRAAGLTDTVKQGGDGMP